MQSVPVMHTGKYAGKLLSEIWESDRNYVMFLAKSFKQGTYTDYRGITRQSVPTADDVIVIDFSKKLVKEFFEGIERKNKEECKSEFIGVIGKRMHGIECKVESIKKYDEYTIINVVDDRGNLAYIYDKDYNLKVGDKVTISGTPTKHVEKMGKKTTYLNRVSISSGGEIEEEILHTY